ncbi:hypothetical protein FA270_30295, partial [Pseudomonas aeruginosa]|nr:hypothetical protein [Pseudomonas aeruginosa]
MWHRPSQDLSRPNGTLDRRPGPRETAANCPKLPTLFSDDFLRPYKSASYETSKKECSGQPIPDSGLSFSSATAGGSPS